MIRTVEVNSLHGNDFLPVVTLKFECLKIPVRDANKKETGKVIDLRKCVDVIGNRSFLYLIGKTSKDVKKELDKAIPNGYYLS